MSKIATNQDILKILKRPTYLKTVYQSLKWTQQVMSYNTKFQLEKPASTVVSAQSVLDMTSYRCVTTLQKSKQMFQLLLAHAVFLFSIPARI